MNFMLGFIVVDRKRGIVGRKGCKIERVSKESKIAEQCLVVILLTLFKKNHER